MPASREMKIAFYAPMKPPDHPVPSGDRAIARALVHALRIAGHDVRIASRLRTYDRHGDARVQDRHRGRGRREASRLVARYVGSARPDLWFTYHLHHKAPDCVGPAVAHALAIPYVVAEASVAAKHADGPWAAGYAIALDAVRAADMIVFLNAADVAGVGAARSLNAKSAMLAPFIDVSRFAASNESHEAGESGCVRLVTVAIMRDGGKLASYRMLASALARMRDVRFELTIVGEGDARDRVAQAFAPIADRVQFCGMLAPDDVAIVLRRSDVFVWPAVDEVIGIALLEAQACGVPVVAGWTPGVAGIVADGTTGFLTPPGDVDAFASGVRRLATDRWLRERMRANAIAYVRAHHSVHVAAARLDAILQEVVSSRPARVPPALSTALSPVLP